MSAQDRDRRAATPTGATRRTRGRAARVCGVGLGLALAATPTEAFWTATSTPGSSGRSVATTVADGPTPSIVVSNRRDLRVSWDATTLGDGTAVTGYVVRRYDESGAEQTVTGGCAGTVTTTSCTETAVPDGLWTYRVTPRFESWSGATGAAGTGRADTTPPRNDIDRQAVSGGSVRIGASTYYYRGREAGSFRLVNRLTDPGGSGPRESVTGALSASGWSHVPSSVATPEGGPYVSNLLSWEAGTTSEFDFGVAGIDQYGNTAAATISIRLDDDAPTGGAIDYADGPTSSRTVRVSVADVDDARSGVGSRILEGAFAPLSGNVCGAWSAWQTATQNPGSSVSFAVEPGFCYRARYVVVDRVGNVLTVGSPKVIKARDYAATITGTPGLVGYWRLDDGGNNPLAATRGSDGTYHGGPTRRQPGAIVGDDDRSVSFDGADDYARVGRTVSSAFSLEFWFRSDQGIGTGSNWYDGAGMVDAEVGGVANDFGVSLLADGRVAAGVGNPDRTALSGAGFNDSQWHHVVMTRNAGNGVVELWVDGQRRGSVTGGTQALDASAHIDIGRLQTGVNHYRGRIDEVAVYDRVLPAATVENHWRSGLP